MYEKSNGNNLNEIRNKKEKKSNEKSKKHHNIYRTCGENGKTG